MRIRHTGCNEIRRYFIDANPKYHTWIELHKNYYTDGSDLILIFENGQVKTSFAATIKRIIFGKALNR